MLQVASGCFKVFAPFDGELDAVNVMALCVLLS